MPKSFYDLQLQRPKNMSNFAIVGKEALLAGANGGMQGVEEHMLKQKREEKEQELKALQEVLNKVDNAFGDDSVGDVSINQGPAKKNYQDGGITRPFS